MKHLLYFSLSLALTLAEEQLSATERFKKQNCSPNLPNLSVGDFNLTQATFEKFKQDNEIFVLGISDSQCEQCCFTEGMLNSVHTGFQTQMHTYGKVS
jgi:hypothetical protein